MKCVILVFVATLMCISCVRIFPIDGVQIMLSKEFNVKPSPVALVEFTTEPINSVLTTQTVQPYVKEATYDMETKSLEQVIVKSTIMSTTEGPAELSTSLPEASTTTDAIGVIAPTKVVQNIIMETYDIPSQHLRPPKE